MNGSAEELAEATGKAEAAIPKLEAAAEGAAAAAEKLSDACETERQDKQYYCLQDTVGGINSACLEIKKWSVTSASIVALIGQLGVGRLGYVMAIVAILSLSFWITEAIWRETQAAFITHIRAIEKDDNVLSISRQWSKNYLGDEETTRSVKFWTNFFKPETYLPHGIIFAVSGVLALLIFCGNLDLGTDDSTQTFRFEMTVPTQSEGG